MKSNLDLYAFTINGKDMERIDQIPYFRVGRDPEDLTKLK